MKMAESYPNGKKTLRGKGEIAPYEQFLLFPQCFQITCTADMEKQGLVWKRVKQHVINQSTLGCLFQALSSCSRYSLWQFAI